MQNLADEYFDWLYSLVWDDRTSGRSYREILTMMHNTTFTYFMVMDENRYADGIGMRYRFGYENDVPDRIIEDVLDVSACSVLEMMIALAVRCEEHIMDDPDIGNRTGVWFWDMMNNLGLADMDDDHFDMDAAEYILDRFVSRRYRRNGSGGLFITNDPDVDMRNIEIWYQMMDYLNEIIAKGDGYDD